MKPIKIFTFSRDLALSNKYLKVTIQSLELKIFIEKVEVLFDFFIIQNKTSTFTLNILSYKDCMVNSKYFFDRAKSRL